MTDYLEELLENTGALLEQIRRLERSGAVPAADAPSPAPLEGRRGPQPPEEGQDVPPEKSAPENGDAFQSGNQDGALEPPRRVLTPLETEETGLSSPLLDQLERLEQAAELARGGLPAIQRGGTAYPQALVKPGGQAPAPHLEGLSDWSAGGGPEQPLPLPGHELRWAEQADRAFRRDSRRYDGGFYLY